MEILKFLTFFDQNFSTFEASTATSSNEAEFEKKRFARVFGTQKRTKLNSSFK
jgi:hypothetical protein